MNFEIWCLFLGTLMLAMVLSERFIKGLPFTSTILYLVVGLAMGPFGAGILVIDPLEKSSLLERATEIGVIISLFTAGLKLQRPLRDVMWKIPLRLAFLSMALTVGMITAVGVWLLDLPLGAAILLGAILAPTDPVLASEVQLEHPGDRDRIRFGLTAEAGLNDGSAFPFVMLGLGLLGVHEIGESGWRWVVVDLLWATSAGLGIGWVLGRIIRRLVDRLRAEGAETPGRDEFLALGLIGLSYGLAILLHAYGFLAVFAAGLAFRRAPTVGEDEKSQISGPVLDANEQLERLMEIGLVLLLAGMLSSEYLTSVACWFGPLLFLVIRPLAVFLGMAGNPVSKVERGMLSWFGIRGIGSLYYLMFALEHGVPESVAKPLCSIVLSLVAMSILVHGFSVTPLMRQYEATKRRRRSRQHR
jgi:NhaP-type Na+/H+ or K+/H+ antiporter